MTSFFYEDLFKTCSADVVVGVDEVGYGALAGPVVSAAVFIPDRCVHCVSSVRDSKSLSPTKRAAIFEELKIHTAFGVGFANVHEICTYNILAASHIAMRRALKDLSQRICTIDLVLVDGIRNLDSDWKTKSIVKGDSLSASIAAASIIAKVTRDRFMAQLHSQFPEYGWNKNCGYGTKTHIAALMTHGTTPHHRHTFAPVKNFAQLPLQYTTQSTK